MTRDEIRAEYQRIRACWAAQSSIRRLQSHRNHLKDLAGEAASCHDEDLLVNITALEVKIQLRINREVRRGEPGLR